MSLTRKQKAGCLTGIFGVLVSMPLWYWLLYQILVRVNATELMWFLYWVYVPAGIALSIAGQVVSNLMGDK